MEDEPSYDDYEASGEAGQDIQAAFANIAQGLTGENRQALVDYWQNIIDSIERIDETGESSQEVFKSAALPLARIKKVMKMDSAVRMISAEAPILFAKGCDIFITELTMRAWIHAEENKRRTLQRSDIAMALQKSDLFDFLIDIVPREEALPSRKYQPSASTPDSNQTSTDIADNGIVARNAEATVSTSDREPNTLADTTGTSVSSPPAGTTEAVPDVLATKQEAPQRSPGQTQTVVNPSAGSESSNGKQPFEALPYQPFVDAAFQGF